MKKIAIYFISILILICCALGLIGSERQSQPIGASQNTSMESGGNEQQATGHEHEYGKTIMAPTCTSDGCSIFECICGYQLIDNFVPATGHLWGEWNIITNSTESSEGLMERCCVVCATIDQKNIAMLEHVHNHKEIIVHSTCEADGYKILTCDCGDVITELIVSNGHDYKTSVILATCVEPGYTIHTCQICQDSYIDDNVSAHGHVFLNYMSNRDASCTGDGTKTSKCDNCDSIDTTVDLGSKLEHQYEEIVVSPTCTDIGYTTMQCFYCNQCYTINRTNALDHDWGNWRTEIEPTTKDAGQKRRSCQRCEAYELQTINRIIEYINLSQYDRCITYVGLTDIEVQIAKDLLAEYDKYQRGEVDRIWRVGNERLDQASRRRLHCFFGIYFSSFDRMTGFMGTVTYKSENRTDAMMRLDVLQECNPETKWMDEYLATIIATFEEGTETEKLLQIAEWLKDNLDYNINVLDAYDALQTKTGNCNAFAMLFQRMASMLGIHCDICIGYSDSARHAWNVVTLESGEQRFYDVCYYNSTSQANKYINATTSPWSSYGINDYWYDQHSNEGPENQDQEIIVSNINLSNYQFAISYTGLSDKETEIVKTLLFECEKYQNGLVNQIRYYGDERISYESYCRMNTFFSIYFYNWTDREEFMSVVTSGQKSDVVLHENVIDKYIKEKAAVDKFVEDALKTMAEGTETEKLQQIADYLRDALTYESGAVDAYTAVTTKKANCNAFAFLFKAMASRIGIQCDLCIGYSNSGSHAWNRVILSDGTVKFYDVCYYNSSGNTKYLNCNESPWKDYVINNYWYL